MAREAMVGGVGIRVLGGRVVDISLKVLGVDR